MWDSTQKLYDGVLKHDRTSLARAITLIESSREDHRRQAAILLDSLLQARAQREQGSGGVLGSRVPPTFRVGVAGPPGAGKSTLIEAVGMRLVQQGHRVAVVAIDPSSSRTGGSILGDKTRMTELSRHPHAFVRPSPTSGALGGVAQHTHDVILLCEGGGYDIVLVETVGLGQSEVTVDSCVDMLWLVVPPGGGDELQGVKKGIVEVADVILVNKADGHLATAARHAAAEYSRALQLVRWKHGSWQPVVHQVSAVSGLGLPEALATADAFRDTMGGQGHIAAKRQHQAGEWMWNDFEAALVARGKAAAGVKAAAARLQPALAAGFITPRRAAARLLDAFLPPKKTEDNKLA